MNKLIDFVKMVPEPYNDELWYSVLSRYHKMSGNVLERETYRDICPSLFRVESKLPILTMNKSSIEMLGNNQSKIWDVYVNHTLEPYWQRFNPAIRKQLAYNFAIGNEKSKAKMVQRTINQVAMLRYCPLCVNDERKNYGETYWHRTHQISLLTFCPKHKCRLLDSKINNYGFSREFMPSNVDNCPDVNPQYDISESEYEMGAYACQTLKAPYSIETEPKREWIRNAIAGYNAKRSSYLWRLNVKKVTEKIEINYGRLLDVTNFENEVYTLLEKKNNLVQTETYLVLAAFFKKDIGSFL